MKTPIFLFTLLIVTACSTVQPKQASGIPIEWADSIDADFSFADRWRYGEGIFRNEYGQLVCDGLCPAETYNMLDREGRILEDSLPRYYQLIDTTHYYYTTLIDEWEDWLPDSLWYIHAAQLTPDTMDCFTELGVSTYKSLHIRIVKNVCYPAVEWKSPAPDSDSACSCTGGTLKIDKTAWQQGILKALFRFSFYDESGDTKTFTLTGKIHATIENR